MTSKIEKRLERLEERMASRLRPRVSDEEIEALMRQEHPESTPDPHDYDDERVAASVGLQRLVEAFGKPTWRCGEWHWPSGCQEQPGPRMGLSPLPQVGPALKPAPPVDEPRVNDISRGADGDLEWDGFHLRRRTPDDDAGGTC